jgi:hypothetical protein
MGIKFMAARRGNGGGFFAALTKRRLRRGAFVVDLQAASTDTSPTPNHSAGKPTATKSSQRQGRQTLESIR